MKPTLFLTHATDIISRIEDASKIIINGKDKLTGSISLGFVPSMANDILPIIAKNLKTREEYLVTL